MYNIVFLDIDRVLNRQEAGRDDNEKYCFADYAIESLKYILTSVPLTKIVISSSWRLNTTMFEDILGNKLWIDVLRERLGDSSAVIGSIGNDFEFPDIFKSEEECSAKSVHGHGRGDDIKKWLDDNRSLGIGQYVIIDDSASCGNIPYLFPNNYVDCDQTDKYEGLSKRNAERAVWILQNFGANKPLDNVYVTSDQHFGHSSIIKYCDRPFKSVSEMNEELIKRWNNTVPENAEVWHLGDFAFGECFSSDKKTKVQMTKDVISQLHGKINIVLGNHDRQGKKSIVEYYEMGFHRVYDKPVLLNDFFLLSHAPVLSDSNKSFINIFGHVHTSSAFQTITENSACVCAERWNYTPVKMTDLILKISSLRDHHNMI